MQQFNLDVWLQDKIRKVVTRDGREVDLYYSPTSRIPLIGATTSDNEIHQYTKDGFQCDTFNQAKNDLFFADDEEELNEFEKELKAMIQDVERGDFIDESFGFWKNRLLNLARKELMSEISDFEIYDKGFKEGKKYALKELSK